MLMYWLHRRFVANPSYRVSRRPNPTRRVETNWKQIKGNVKEQWDNLTDDELDVIADVSKPEQLEQNVKAVEWTLSADDLTEIDRTSGQD